MKVAVSLLLWVAVCVVALGSQAAGEKKEVTLTGKIMCAKCALKEAKVCLTVIQVKENNKEVTYYFNDKGIKEDYHEEVCGGERRDGTVKGTVAEKDKKKWISPKKVDYAKK